MTSVIALQAVERLAKTESLIDSVLQIQKQNDRLIRYGRGTMITLMLVVVVAFVGSGYQSIKVGKNIASLQTNVSLLKTDISLLQADVSLLLEEVSLLLEEVSEGIAELRSEKSNLKTKNGTVVHNKTPQKGRA